MTAIDQALVLFESNPDDHTVQSQFYDLFLNATFFVPVLDDQEGVEEGEVAPLIVTADESDYLLLFDTEQRLRDWAQAEVNFVEVPGHVLAEMSEPPLHWALNVGAEHSKQFFPDEIAWLRDVVERCNAADTSQPS